MIAVSMQEQEYTVEEVARRLRVSEMTVIRRIAAGKLRARREGHVWRINERDLEAYLHETYEQGKPQGN